MADVVTLPVKQGGPESQADRLTDLAKDICAAHKRNIAWRRALVSARDVGKQLCAAKGLMRHGSGCPCSTRRADMGRP